MLRGNRITVNEESKNELCFAAFLINYKANMVQSATL